MPVRLLAILYFGTGENSFWHSESTNTALFKGRFQSLFYKWGTRDCAIIRNNHQEGGGGVRHALSVFEANKTRGFTINSFLLGNTKYVRLKVLSKGVSSQGTENWGMHFFLCFHMLRASSFPLFFPALSFFLLQMLWILCQFDMSPYI